MNKKDKQDLLKLADIIETKEFWNKKDEDGDILYCLPENKRDGKQFNLEQWFFYCGMPSCAAGHAFVNFRERFYEEISVNSGTFARAFGLRYEDSARITWPDSYSSKNPTPKTVAKRIREVVSQIKVETKP